MTSDALIEAIVDWVKCEAGRAFGGHGSVCTGWLEVFHPKASKYSKIFPCDVFPSVVGHRISEFPALL